jgi:hypothetical protein
MILKDIKGLGGRGGLYEIISSNVIFITTGQKMKGHGRRRE